MVSIQVKKSVGGKLKHSQMEQEGDRGRRKDESGKKTNTKENEGTEATSTNEAEKVSAGVFKMGYTTV